LAQTLTQYLEQGHQCWAAKLSNSNKGYRREP